MASHSPSLDSESLEQVHYTDERLNDISFFISCWFNIKISHAINSPRFRLIFLKLGLHDHFIRNQQYVTNLNHNNFINILVLIPIPFFTFPKRLTLTNIAYLHQYLKILCIPIKVLILSNTRYSPFLYISFYNS